MKCTKVQLIAFEAITELGPIDLENSPVLRETVFTNTKTDGWRAEDVAKDMVTKYFPVLVDLIEKCCECLHCVLGLVQQPLSLDPGCLCLLSANSVGTLLPLHEIFNLSPPELNSDAVSSNPEFDRINKVGEGSLAEQEDFSGRHTGVVNVVDVGFLWSNEDMTARKAQEVVAITTFCEVEGHCPLSVGPGLGRDGEAKGRSEGTNDVNEWVQVIDGLEKLGTGLACVKGFAVVNVDIGDLIVPEKGQDVLSCVVGSRSGGRLGEDPNPDGDRTNDRFLSLDRFFILVLFITLNVFFILRRFVNPDLLETNNIYRCKANLEILVSKLYNMMRYYN